MQEDIKKQIELLNKKTNDKVNDQLENQKSFFYEKVVK